MQAIIGYIVLILFIIVIGKAILIVVRKVSTIRSEADKLFLDYITMLESLLNGIRVKRRRLPIGSKYENIEVEGKYKDRFVVCGFSAIGEGNPPYPTFKMKLNKAQKHKLFMIDYPRPTKHTFIKGDWLVAKTYGLLEDFRMNWKKKFSREYVINMLSELYTAVNIFEGSVDSYA